ncbi:sulfurtransferase TusA family protein [archaeon]|nr:sulfurtransferase TusA family protein [archaeon]
MALLLAQAADTAADTAEIPCIRNTIRLELKKREDGTYELDVRSYEGPPLALFILNTLKKIERGSLLLVLYDDPSSRDNFEAAFNRDGYKIVEMQKGAGEFRMTIKKD